MDEDNADVKVEVEEDVIEQPINIDNQTPMFIVNGIIKGWTFLTMYGWFVLFGLIIMAMVWNRLKPYMRRLLKKREEAQEYEAYKADPDEAMTRQEAMGRARRRLQEQHDANAARFAEQQQLKEAEKRQAKLDDWDRHQKGQGYRSKVKAKDDPKPNASTSSVPKKKTTKNTYRPNDYSPLGGSSSDSSYRAPRRGGASGGG